jgi:hypothetical protein
MGNHRGRGVHSLCAVHVFGDSLREKKMGPEFFQTRTGQIFYQGTMPRIARALERIANVLELNFPVEDDNEEED